MTTHSKSESKSSPSPAVPVAPASAANAGHDHGLPLDLDRVLPFVGAEATNEEKIAALSVVPQLVTDPHVQLPALNAALDHGYVRKLLKARSSTQFQAIALEILAVLASHAQVAQSSQLHEYLVPLTQLVATPAQTQDSTPNAIAQAALDVLLRLGSHSHPPTALALLSNPGPFVDAFLVAPASSDRQAALSAFLLHLAHTAGPRIHPSLTLLNLLRTRLTSSSSSSPLPSSDSLPLLTLLTSLLETVPSTLPTSSSDHDLASALPLAPLITSLLRTRGTPQALVRATLRLAAAYLAHAPRALACDATTWIVVLTAASVELCMLLDDGLPDPLAGVTEVDDQLETLVGACCAVLEHQVSALVEDGALGTSDKCWHAWRHHAANVLLAAGAYLAPVTAALAEGDSPPLLSDVVLAVARLACRIMAEADDEMALDDAAPAAPGGSGSFDVGGDSGPEAGIGAVVYPLAVHLVIDTRVPDAALPWAAAYLARASADEDREQSAPSVLEGVARRLAEYVVQDAADCDVVTNLASVVLNLVMLGDDQEGAAIPAMQSALQVLTSALDSDARVDTLFVQPMAASRRDPTCAQAAGQAFGTLLGALAMTLRALVASSGDPARPAFHLVPTPMLRRILHLAPVYVHACWRMGNAAQELADLVHLVLDPLAALCYSSASLAGKFWRDPEQVLSRRALFKGVKVPSGAEDEAAFLGVQ